MHVLALVAWLAGAGWAQNSAAVAPTAESFSAAPPAPPEAVAAPPLETMVDDLLQGSPPSLIYVDPDGSNWLTPWTWIPRDHWTNSAELGINGSSGNANSFSFQAGTRFKRKTDTTLFDLRVTHNRQQSNGVEKQHNALLYEDFDHNFRDTPWSQFVKNGIEYDRFKAFNLRYNLSIGLAYRFIKSENLNLKGRFGSGTSREFGGPEDRWVPEALFGGDYEHQLNKRNKWIARADYFPEWGNFSNYRIVSDASWEMLWDDAGNLSFKIGAIDRYDSTPNGKQPNDLTYSMLLLYKF